MLPYKRRMSRRTRYALVAVVFLLVAIPVRAAGGHNEILDLLGGILTIFGVVMLVLLPGALIGANLAFAARKRFLCILGAIAGNIPVLGAYALWGGDWNDRSWDGFFFTLVVYASPIVAVLVGVPVGYITYEIRSRIAKLSDEDATTPE